jgi:hypothetical protein
VCPVLNLGDWFRTKSAYLGALRGPCPLALKSAFEDAINALVLL